MVRKRASEDGWPRHWLLWTMLVAVLLRILVAVLSQPYLENLADARTWRLWGSLIASGQNPYIVMGPLANFPPVWPFTLGILVAIFGSSMAVIIPYKIVLSLIDVSVVAFIYLIATRGGVPARYARWLAITYALHPVILMVIGVQGQIDPLAMSFVLLAILLFDGKGRGRFLPQDKGALALGMAIAVKTFPVMFVPLFLFRRSVRRIRFLVALAIPGLLFSAPFLTSFESIRAFLTDVLGYGSSYGYYGISYLLSSSPALQAPNALFLAGGKYLMLASFVVVGYLMRSRPLAHGALAVTLAFFVFTPGWGVQYLAWGVALSLLSPSAFAVGFVIVSSIAAGAYYASELAKIVDLPVFSASALSAIDITFRFVVWFFCIAWLVVLLRRSSRDAKRTTSRRARKATS